MLCRPSGVEMTLSFKGQNHSTLKSYFFLDQKKIARKLIVLETQKELWAEKRTAVSSLFLVWNLSWIFENLTWISEIWSHSKHHSKFSEMFWSKFQINRSPLWEKFGSSWGVLTVLRDLTKIFVGCPDCPKEIVLTCPEIFVFCPDCPKEIGLTCPDCPKEICLSWLS